MGVLRARYTGGATHACANKLRNEFLNPASEAGGTEGLPATVTSFGIRSHYYQTSKKTTLNTMDLKHPVDFLDVGIR